MTRDEAIFEFWSSFGLAAYEETTVPSGDDAPKLPYLTYQGVSSGFGTEAQVAVSLWYFTTSLVAVNAKADEISKRIGMGGVVIPCDGGAVWIKRGSPFAQNVRASNEREGLLQKYINVSIEFLVND